MFCISILFATEGHCHFLPLHTRRPRKGHKSANQLLSFPRKKVANVLQLLHESNQDFETLSLTLLYHAISDLHFIPRGRVDRTPTISRTLGA